MMEKTTINWDDFICGKLLFTDLELGNDLLTR